MFPTFEEMPENKMVIFVFSKLYLYSFISLFIYVVLSLFISVIMDTYETVKVRLPLYHYRHELGFIALPLQNPDKNETPLSLSLP